jgi:DNA-directed RNA polymerase alpha subunit
MKKKDRNLGFPAFEAEMVQVLASIQAGLDRKAELLEIFAKKSRMQEDAPVEDFPLSIRAKNCLHAEGINTAGKLVSHSRNALLKIPNLGPKTVMEIEVFLAYEGLELEPSPLQGEHIWEFRNRH